MKLNYLPVTKDIWDSVAKKDVFDSIYDSVHCNTIQIRVLPSIWLPVRFFVWNSIKESISNFVQIEVV